MKLRRALAITLVGSCLTVAAGADKVTRSVNSQGVPTISIKGHQKTVKPVEIITPAQSPKEFQVYELDGEGAPAPDPAPQIVIIPSPPPIAPNPAAWGFGFGFPWFGPGNPVGPCFNNFPPGQPLNYQNPPVNYQNPPVNYQNPPANYQPGVLPPPNQHFRRH